MYNIRFLRRLPFVLLLMMVAVTWVVASDDNTARGASPEVLAFDQNKVRLDQDSEGRYHLVANDVNVAELVKFISVKTGVKINVDDDLARNVISIDEIHPDVESLIKSISDSYAMIFERQGDEVRLVAATATSQQDPVAPATVTTVVNDASPVASSPRNVAPANDAVPPHMLTNTRRPMSELRRSSAPAIVFSGAILDTEILREEGIGLDIPDQFKAPPESVRYIVQFSRNVSDQDRATLVQAGAEVSHYLPHRAYAIRMAPEKISDIKQIDGVYVVEPYHPYYKMSSGIREKMIGADVAKLPADPMPFTLMTFAGSTIDASALPAGVSTKRIEMAGASQVITFEAPPSALVELLRQDHIQWVEPYQPAEAMDDLGTRRMRVPALRRMHPTLNGEGVIVAVTDSGVDFLHQAFSDIPGPTSTNINTRIEYYETRLSGTSDGIPGDNDGHGTHVASSILGNGALSSTVIASPGSKGPPYSTNQFAGVAPKARLVMLEDFNSFSDNDQAQTGYRKGARISNNSWGFRNFFDYGTASAIWDNLVRDADPASLGNQEYIVFFSAGNSGGGLADGTGATPNTIGMPGNAKNVITMGALEQKRRVNNIMGVFFGENQYFSDQHTDSDWQVANFSSRGPVSLTDLRVKPDLVAPGSYVISAQSRDVNADVFNSEFNHYDYRYGNVDTGTNYAYSSGTSMSSPLGAGAAALIYQHLTNSLSRPPSPALMKAVMVAGARTINSLVYKRPLSDESLEIIEEGWGLIDVERSVAGLNNNTDDDVIMLDQANTQPLQTDEEFTYSITLNPGDGGLRVVLAYTDKPGTPGAGIMLVNDLDMVIRGPNGSIYRGNQYRFDGVHSWRFTASDPVERDQYNNVESITIPDAEPGTYEIEISGTQVPLGPQDFALVVHSGMGFQGRVTGRAPSIALDTNSAPVIAFSQDTSTDGGLSNLTRQIMVRRWVGNIGDVAEIGDWKRMEDQWVTVGSYDEFGGIDETLENSDYPSVAVRGEHVYVAWEEGIQSNSNSPIREKRIFLKHFNGTHWVQLGGSATGYGVSRNTNRFDAIRPAVGVMGDGSPVVAWLQFGSGVNSSRVFVARWNGSQWVGLAGSHTNGLPTAQANKKATDLSLVINSAGNPVVAFKETDNSDGIVVLQWNGTSWSNISPLDSLVYLTIPRLAAGPSNTLALAWQQTAESSSGNFFITQLYASRYNGSSWSGVGGSTTFPGISAATNNLMVPWSLDVGMGTDGSISVAWQGSTNANTRTMLVKKWQPGATSWTEISSSAVLPGITGEYENYTNPRLVVDAVGLPIITFGNFVNSIGVEEVQTYTLIADRFPPVFAGLQTAIGGTNGNVQLGWNAAQDLSTQIVYTIFRSPSAVACGSNTTCVTNSVFGNPVAQVTNATSFTVNGLVNNSLYCFAVRARDASGLSDANTVMIQAGPASGVGDSDGDCLSNTNELAAGTKPCIPDTDGDGMRDGWEWHFSTNNLGHTNVLAMDPLDNGVINLRTNGAGNSAQLGFADLDGDGAANIEEHNWFIRRVTNNPCAFTNSPDPTRADTDGDGLADGWEMIYNLDPVATNDPALDGDCDGLTLIQEFLAGSDPNNPDTDGDGLYDGTWSTNKCPPGSTNNYPGSTNNYEGAFGTSPTLADTDLDGVDDGVEVVQGTSPVSAISVVGSLTDGDLYQLGWTNRAITNVLRVLYEDFEAGAPAWTNWTHNAPNPAMPFDFWHLSTAEPGTILTNGIRYFNTRTTNTAYRMANDLTRTNVNATYAIGNGIQALIQNALYSPRFDATNESSLLLTWNEYYETEPGYDFLTVQARGGSDPNWYLVGTQVSGQSINNNPLTGVVTNDWVSRSVDLTRFAGRTNVQVRFLFSAQNAINNHYRGWWVDDVAVIGTRLVSGWVRDEDGKPLERATVQVIGRGGLPFTRDGMSVIPPGKIMAEAVTAQDGSFTIPNVFPGQVYLKASAPGYQAEFYNGQLFVPPYSFGAGINMNPGVAGIDEATNGWVNIVSNSFDQAFFELARGAGRAFLGIRSSNSNAPVLVDGASARVWNGSNTVNTATAVHYRAVSDLSMLTNNRPDWISNPVMPRFISEYAQGEHWVQVGTNMPVTLPTYDLREGETLIVDHRTNRAIGSLFVTTEDQQSYPVWLNGMVIGATPLRTNVAVGPHKISLIRNNGFQVGIKSVVVKSGPFNVVNFTRSDVDGPRGSFLVQAEDIFGNTLVASNNPGVQVHLNGRLYATNQLPLLVTNLLYGEHFVRVMYPGYRPSEHRRMRILSPQANTAVFVMADADDDFDLVGDVTEIFGYTNIYLYTRTNDVEPDGLSNVQEFDVFQRFGVRLNPFVRDTDGDVMTDAEEVGFDGFTNRLALSRIAEQAVEGTNTITVYFSGSYLAGIDNFGATGRPVRAAIACDLFESTGISHPIEPMPSKRQVLTRFNGIPQYGRAAGISRGHFIGSTILADTRPDQVDTDGDLMWDGFENAYGYINDQLLPGVSNMILHPLECDGANDDPDADGLSNYLEFLGMDGVANTNDWIKPVDPDTDDDQMPDGWEYTYKFNPLNLSDAYSDIDADGLLNVGEFFFDSNPLLLDTENDGLSDGNEARFGTHPREPDTDRDGLFDGREVWDKNMDGIPDGGFFPNWAPGSDIDRDSLVDGPTDWDTDGDGMPDGFEVIDPFGAILVPGLNPMNPMDGSIDSDGDGLSNLQEYMVRDALFGNSPADFGDPAIWDYSSNPFNPDSDGDGIPDGFEVTYGLHPMDPAPCPNGGGLCTRYGNLAVNGDADADGLWNLREYNIRFLLNSASPTNPIIAESTHPWIPDTDKDGLEDGEEDRSFRSHPIVQDADTDRLIDGVSVADRWGEVESAPRTSVYAFVVSNITWQAAEAAARISHAQVFGSTYSNNIGHLAIISSLAEQAEILALIGTNVVTNAIAIPGLPDLGYAYGGTNFTPGVIDNVGVIAPTTTNVLVSGFVIEWTGIPSVTNHFDRALNDLWQLVWPADPDNNLPYWKKVEIDSSSPVPEPRWGAAMSYVPVFETKNPRNDNDGIILLDNRKLVVIGGRDGVNRHKDVWEYVVRSNAWIRSSQPLAGSNPGYNDGLSEVYAVPVFGYKNTKVSGCPCDRGYNCDVNTFGLPKNRPWSPGAEGGESRSFDWTFIFGGWSEQQAYTLGHWFYKSNDDMRSITEQQKASQGVTEYIDDNAELGARAQNNDGALTFLIGQPGPVQLDGDDALETPTGYSAIQFPEFAINGSCDTVDEAVIMLEMEQEASSDIDVQITAEYSLRNGASDPQYNSDLDSREPSVRLTSVAFFNTISLTRTIPAGQRQVFIDVTEIVRELVNSGSWLYGNIGFVINASGDPDRAVVRTLDSKIIVTYLPSYKVGARWAGAGLLTQYTTQRLSIRKSSGLVYDHDLDRLVMFGGIDGNTVYGDTHVGSIIFTSGYDPLRVDWQQMITDSAPEARWGHSMVYDALNKRVMLFGGFDKNHRPLNDLWFYDVTSNKWSQFTQYRDEQIPMPRGGASMVYYGDYDYDRAIAEYCLGGNKRRVVLFGGTDGKTYFNDTWVFDPIQGRWILISPVGEHSVSPPPRAFASMVFAQNARGTADLSGQSTYQVLESSPCATPVAFLFGGRVGALPTGVDTDSDLVIDGQEHELGGPAAGRDPRINALIITNTAETIPFSLKRIGTVTPLGRVGAIANFESLRHDRPDVEHAALYDLPYESHPDKWTLVNYTPFGVAGVDATRPEDTSLWWHQHGGENPFDARDVWQLGTPDNTVIGTNEIPRYAYSGRWVYGTNLKGTYPNDANMELYSPLFSLTLPSLNSTSPNNNSFYLVFHEWLDLADQNDVVRIDAIRPETPADIFNRKTGVNRPVRGIMANRNNAHNTTGQWRRHIIPLDILGNESNLYLRFTLQSDGANPRPAGGWFIDDVAIMQAAQINGTFTNPAMTVIQLLGENFNGHVQNQTATTNQFQFGLLPLGNYQLVASGVTNVVFVTGPNLVTNLTATTPAPIPAPEFVGMASNSPLVITWAVSNGFVYSLQTATNMMNPVWSDLSVQTSVFDGYLSYTDAVPSQQLFYRITATNAP